MEFVCIRHESGGSPPLILVQPPLLLALCFPEKTGAALRQMGFEIPTCMYPGLDNQINDDDALP